MSPDFDNIPVENAIETRDLGRKFGKFVAVKNVSLTVPKGTVFGLLGVNGAGKSTIIKMVMGHLQPTSGEIRVLGRTLGEDLLGIRRRVAYVSENRYLYEWMTVEESLRFTRAFHETWDDKKAADLLKRFSLPAEKKVRQLSRGNRARLCLLLALSFNPELIVLDEPTSGLDPIVRRDFIENIVAEIAEEGKTVLFSSHIVEEIERVADYVGIINEGELLLVSTIDEIKASYKRVRYATNGTRPEVAGVPGVLAVENGRHEQVLTVSAWGDETLRLLGERGVKNPEVLPISLEDIFVNTVRAERERRANS
ncbi:MAG: type transport system ATP-binding protein [Acidobacteriota bacterium]|jgi:ABC-2 type transport system ATP-binding protein|nr:type transport system ATP-binding protein [Acidobacteriota bacterium]